MVDINAVYIVSGCRTPIGSFGESFKSTSAVDLGSVVIKEALNRANIKPERVSEVIMGQVLTGGQGPNPSRLSSLKAGIPNTVPAYTVNMLCGSGLKSVYLGYLSIKSGEASVIVAGGQENMSMTHHSTLLRPGTGMKCGHWQFTDNIDADGMNDPNLHMFMGDTAEHLAQRYKISRARQDAFANNSQFKAVLAKENTFFYDEIVPVKANGRVPFTLYEDECPNPEITLEDLSKYEANFRGLCTEPCHYKPNTRTLFQRKIERSVTAGNSSGANDGAAAVVLCNSYELRNSTSYPLGKIVGFGQCGLAPEEMGCGPIQAVRNLLYKIKWTINEVDLFEINEAFAVQSIIVADELRIPEDKLNINGGAIALGNPIGCSGTRVLVTLLYNLRRLNKKKGIAALCIGGGMGIAIAVEHEPTQSS